MSMKTILVPMENNDMQSALETALLLGQRNNSYIEGFALRWQVIELIAGIDAMGGIPLDRFKEDVEEEAKKAKQIFEIFMQDHGVPRSTETTETVSFGWLDHAAEGEGFIGNYGRVFDVMETLAPCTIERLNMVYSKAGDQYYCLHRRLQARLQPTC